MTLDPATRDYIKRERDRIARQGRKVVLPKRIMGERCQHELGPFSANPGGTCGRPVMGENTWCGIHNPDRPH